MAFKQQQIKDRLGDYAGSAKRNPSWALMDVISRFESVRRLMRLSRVAANPVYPIEKSVFAETCLESAHQQLKREGYLTGFQLPQPMVDSLQSFSDDALCYGNKDRNLGFHIRDLEQAQCDAGTQFSIAVYHNVERQLPLIHELARDPLVMQIAANYFCTAPVYLDCRLWWTFPVGQHFDRTKTSAFFHSDRDDYSALRLFFYLSDVDDESGPHELISGSHTNKRLRDLFSLAERNNGEIEGSYGQDRVRRITGPQGSGFMEDPFIFHRSTRPTARPRLVLQLRFATRNHNQFAAANDEQKAAPSQPD